MFPAHKPNYQLIKSYPTNELAWSIFCANVSKPKYPTPQYPVPADCSADNLVIQADSPPAWSSKLPGLPLLGNYLNILVQFPDYETCLEDIVDVIAGDLEKGLNSESVGKRVKVKDNRKVR